VAFFSAYRHGFVRVAACTHHTTLADPATNAESVLRMARDCHDDGVALVVFPELTLSGYSIEDILVQLRAGAGACWQSVHGSAAKNTTTKFVSKTGSPSGAFLAP